MGETGSNEEQEEQKWENENGFKKESPLPANAG
jgi:hypothetical protein